MSSSIGAGSSSLADTDTDTTFDTFASRRMLRADIFASLLSASPTREPTTNQHAGETCGTATKNLSSQPTAEDDGRLILSWTDETATSTNPSLESHTESLGCARTPVENNGALSLSTFLADHPRSTLPAADDGTLSLSSFLADHPRSAEAVQGLLKNFSPWHRGQEVVEKTRDESSKNFTPPKSANPPTEPKNDPLVDPFADGFIAVKSKNSQRRPLTADDKAAAKRTVSFGHSDKASKASGTTASQRLLTCIRHSRTKQSNRSKQKTHHYSPSQKQVAVLLPERLPNRTHPAETNDDAASATLSWITPAPTPEERKQEQITLARQKILNQQRIARRQQEERLGDVIDNAPRCSIGADDTVKSCDFASNHHCFGQPVRRQRRGKGQGLSAYLEREGAFSAISKSISPEVEEKIDEYDLLSVFQWSTGLAAKAPVRAEEQSVQTAPQRGLTKTRAVVWGRSVGPIKSRTSDPLMVHSTSKSVAKTNSNCSLASDNPITHDIIFPSRTVKTLTKKQARGERTIER